MSNRRSSHGGVDDIPAVDDDDSPLFRFNEAGPLPIAIHCKSSFPDKLIVKKHVKPLPLLELRAKLVYNTHTNTFSGRCSCKDTILGGRIALDSEAQTISYKKRFNLADSAAVAFSGSVSYTGSTPPSARLEFYFHQGHAVLSRDRWSLKHTALLGDSVGLQVKGGFRVPTPAAQYDIGGGEGTRLRTSELQVFLDEANLVLKL